MSEPQQDADTERFYKLSYFVIPIPMVLGLAFAAYVLITEDSRNQSYCTVAKQHSAYQKSILEPIDFISHESMPLNLCKEKDDVLDDGDGQVLGQVRWFVCKGTVCGPGWEKLLALP